MAKSSKQQYLVMKDGTRYEIVGENSRYWKCKNTQFSKSNPNIDHIEKAAKPAKVEEKEE